MTEFNHYSTIAKLGGTVDLSELSYNDVIQAVLALKDDNCINCTYGKSTQLIGLNIYGLCEFNLIVDGVAHYIKCNETHIIYVDRPF